MKIEIADAAGLPEALKSLAVTDGDKTTLDLTALAPVSELDKFKAKAMTAANEAIERRKALDAWKALGETPEAVAEALAAKNKPDPDQQKIVETMKARHAEEITAANEKYQQVLRRTTQAELKAELARVGFVAESIDVFAASAMGRVKFDDAGTPQVFAADGSSPMIGNGANGGATLADLAGELAKNNPYAVKDSGIGGGGTPNSGQGGKPGQKTVSRAQFDQMSQAERSAFSKEGGKVTD